MANEIHPRQGIRDIPAICGNLGIKNVIISPGSRNAPLIIAFAKYSSIKCLSITDERSAAFFALGMAQYTQKPLALICTSGTAVLNFAPAIAEAYYQNIPLLIITADRPKEWIDQADGQTIRQNNIFQNYCKVSFELPVETRNEDELWHSNSIISQAINIASLEPYGPVHINVPLREPLYNPLPEVSDNIQIIQTASNKLKIDNNQKEYISEKWNSCKKKLIIFGVLPPDIEISNSIEQLANRADTVIIAENISNISSEKIIYSPEAFFSTIRKEENDQFKPDLLITIGKSIVSKRVKQFIKASKPQEHWHIASNPEFIDTFKSLSRVIVASIPQFLEFIGQISPVESSYSDLYTKRLAELKQLHTEFFQKAVYSDLYIFNLLLQTIPDGSVVHLANSTPVRYSQLFETRSDLIYYSNRGTSGIDGCVSTAAGSAYISGKQTIVITGDIAFLYDSNALWNNNIGQNLKIIVINNKGGNIFRLIDTSAEIVDILDFFETPQNVNIKKIAEAFNFGYQTIDNTENISHQLHKFFALSNSAIFEFKTDPIINTKVYRDYYLYIKQLAIV